MVDKIITEALEIYEDAEDRLSTLRQDALDEAKFSRLGDQWDEAIVKKRREEGKPIVTINKLPSFIRQIVNEARMNRPSIMISPVDGGADKATAEVMQAIIQHIARKSNADVAYDTALEHAVTFGFGFFRLFTDYEHDESFDMAAYVGRITDPLQVTWDVDTTAVDASDWRYAFVADDVSERAWGERFGKSTMASFGNDDGGATKRHDDMTRIVEYWRKKETKEKLLLIRSFDGSLTPWREKALIEEMEQGRLIPGTFEVSRERDTTAIAITQYLLSGDEILEENEWPGKSIPICPVWGTDITLDGERHLQSAVHDAIDSQRLYNIWRATTTEMVAMQPKIPYIVGLGSIPEQARHKWETANSRNWAYLEYDPTMGPPPRREQGPQVPSAALQEALSASDDMKAVTGIHDASLGLAGNETSGVAIQSRRRQGNISNFHFSDNLTRAIEYAGRCLADVIPSLYGTRETMRIIGDEGKERVVQISQSGGQVDPLTGEQMVFDLTSGHYDVHAKAGSGYATGREQALEMMTQIIQSVPAAAPLIGDKLVELMDFPGADEIAERIRAATQPQQPPPQQQQQAAGPMPGMPAMPMPTPKVMQ
jgi:hypothetical protein